MQRPKMKWHWDETLQEITEEVAKEFDLDPNQVKWALYRMWERLSQFMKLPEVPKIYLHKFGTFWGNRKTLLNKYNRLRESRDPVDQEEAERINTIRTRITAERSKRSKSFKKLYGRNQDAGSGASD